MLEATKLEDRITNQDYLPIYLMQRVSCVEIRVGKAFSTNNQSPNIECQSELNSFLDSPRCALIQFTVAYYCEKMLNCALNIKPCRHRGLEEEKNLKLRSMKSWWIFILFFRCISGSIFHTGNEKVRCTRGAKAYFHLPSLSLL